jgi:DTW domain-containing protein
MPSPRPTTALPSEHQAELGRAMCYRCFRPESACVCKLVAPLPSKVRVLILQHPRERDKAIGTALLASLCLQGAELFVGTSVAKIPALARAIAEPGVALLYPDQGASPRRLLPTEHAAADSSSARDEVTQSLPREDVRTLLVVDGTWWQAKKLIKLNPELLRLPRFAVAPPAPSEYRIRKEPAEHCLSTLEALMYALDALHTSAGAFEALLTPFRAMVEHQIQSEQTRGDSRRESSRHASWRLRPKYPAPFYETPSRLLCVVGEANAWPYDHEVRKSPGYRDELVQWGGVRLEDGAELDCVLVPTEPLGPRTARLTELDESVLAAGLAFAQARQQWLSFVQPSSVLCTWGDYGVGLFEAEENRGLLAGMVMPIASAWQRLDLREVCARKLQRKAGSLEEACERLGIDRFSPALSVRGRGGRRLTMLRAIALELTRLASADRTIKAAMIKSNVAQAAG